jgi:hypothetical protein
MTLPSPRNSIRPLRGLLATLQADIAGIGEGEIVYATDENRFYVKESGILTVASATAAQGVLADTATQPGDNISTLTNDSGYITLADVTTTADKFVYVNSTDGNDGTGTIDDPGKPFLTIAAAIAAIPGPGHEIIVSPGTYAENNPLVIPSGCILSSSHGPMGWLGDTVEIQPLVNTANLIELSSASSVEGVTLLGPSSAGASCIGNATTASTTNVGLKGQVGGQGNGISVESTGSGKIISFEIRFKGGEFKNLMQVTGGILATESVHVPNVAGTNSIESVFYQDTTTNANLSRLQGQACNSGNSNVTNVYRNNGGTGVFFSLNAFNASNGILLENDSYNVNIYSGLIDTTIALTTDASITGASGKLYVNASINTNWHINNPVWYTSDHFLVYANDKNDTDAYQTAIQLQGGDLIIGNANEAHGAFFGNGTAFSKENYDYVFATSGNTSTTEGNGLVDLSANALDKEEATTFTFNAIAADEAIYFCTTRRDSANNLLKHYGYRTGHLTGDSRDGEYVFEIWTGAAWTAINIQSVNVDQGYNYATDVMWRGGDTHEYIIFGIDSNTSWSLKTINSVNAYWSRIRIVTAPTSLPTLYHIQGLPDGGFQITKSGKQVFFGTAQFRRSLQSATSGLSFTGGVVTGTQQVGTGADQYTHSLTNGTLDGAGDRMYWNIRIPEGTCSAFPYYIDIAYSIQTGFNAVTKPTLGFTFHAAEVAGMFVADPNGGSAPVARTNVNTSTVTTNNPQRQESLIPGDAANTIYNISFGPFYASEYYEGDLITMALDLVDDGSANADITFWDISLRSFRWTEGERQA